MPTCDLVIPCCLEDLPWLSFCLRFLLKNWQEKDSRFIVLLNRDCIDVVRDWKPFSRISYVFDEPWPDTYAYQMYLKMNADQYTDSELITLCDSDVMLMRPAGLEELVDEEGKPRIYYLSWDEAEPVSQAKWRPTTSKVMGMDLDNDYMVTCPFTFHRDTFPLCRDHIARTAGKSFGEVTYSTAHYDWRNFLSHPVIFSEHQALNLYAAKRQPEKYSVSHRPSRNWAFQLFWSHGFNPQIEQQLEEALER